MPCPAPAVESVKGRCGRLTLFGEKGACVSEPMFSAIPDYLLLLPDLCPPELRRGLTPVTGAPPPFLSWRKTVPPPWGLCLGSWMSLVCGEFKKSVLWYCLVTGHVSAWMGLEGTLRPQGGVGSSWVATGGRVRPGGDNRRGGKGRGKNPGPEFPAWPTLQTCLPSREAGAP